MTESRTPVEPHVQNEDRWAPIPESLLYDAAISDGAVRVYATLRRHGDDPLNCYPSYKRIGELIGKSPRTIPALIRSLEVAGWVRRVPRKADDGDFTSNGYKVFGRAQMRGVRAESRAPSTPESAGGSAQERAPKESHLEREQLNDPLSLARRVDEACVVLIERDVLSGNPDNKRAYRKTCARERRTDGTLGVLNELAGAHPDASPEELADLCEGLQPCEEAKPRTDAYCSTCDKTGDHFTEDHWLVGA